MTAVSADDLRDTAAPPPADHSAARRSLFRFSVFYAVFILFHIKFGAMVTSTGAGMAFTDWPLARGSLWPPGMDLEDYLEHLHRIAGFLVGVFGIWLLVRVIRTDRRPWLIKLVWLLGFMILAQGLLGGLGVVYGEENGTTWAPAAVGHGILAQPTLCLAVFIAFALSRGWDEALNVSRPEAAAARKTATFAIVAVFAQLAVGAVVRHTNQQGMLWLHVFMAIAVSIVILIAAAYASKFSSRSKGFRIVSRFTMWLLLTQLLLGFTTLLVRRPKDPSNIEYLARSAIVSGHVVVGASLFLLATLLLAKSWRNLRPAE